MLRGLGIICNTASANSRKDKSLRIMSQKFVMLFLVSKTKIVTLDIAAKILIEETQDTVDHSKFKSKMANERQISQWVKKMGHVWTDTKQTPVCNSKSNLCIFSWNVFWGFFNCKCIFVKTELSVGKSHFDSYLPSSTSEENVFLLLIFFFILKPCLLYFSGWCFRTEACLI